MGEIRLLEKAGLAWDVKVPSAEKIARRRVREEILETDAGDARDQPASLVR